MPRTPLPLLALAAILVASDARAISVCEWVTGVLARRIERRLGVEFAYDDWLYAIPAEVEPASIAAATRELREQLAAQGVEHLPYRRPAEGEPATSALAMLIELGRVLPVTGDQGELRVVSAVQPSHEPGAASPFASVYRHPGTPAVLARLRAIGVPVLADPTLMLVGMRGDYEMTSRTVGIAANADYLTLVHEAAHAEFDHWRVADFAAQVRERIARKRPIEETLLSDSRFAGYGEPRLRRVIELVRAGYGDLALNERMSAEAELAVLKDHGWEIGASETEHTESYARGTVLHDLGKTAAARPLTTAERRTFLQAVVDELAIPDEVTETNRRQHALARRLADLLAPSDADAAHARRVLDSVLFEAYHRSSFRRRAGLTLAGGAAIVAILFHRQLGQVLIHLSDGTILRMILGDDDDDKKKKKRREE